MIEAQATARYIRTSAQKAGLVLDLIRGKNVGLALSTLKFSRKSVARDIAKVLQSAVANAQQKDGYGGDVERLYVAACYAGQGPSFKRVRPAPMGRAFRVLKRTAHLTVHVAERPEKVRPQAARPERAAKGEKPAKGAAKASAGQAAAGEAKKGTARAARSEQAPKTGKASRRGQAKDPEE
jgi:large subunit ribosomal protein L22